ncbi:MAG: hypothetical protein ABW067_15630 [Rhizobacter sp.]
MFYTDEQEVTKELGRGGPGTCNVCGRSRHVWAFLALSMCAPCLTGNEAEADGAAADTGAVQVLKGPET